MKVVTIKPSKPGRIIQKKIKTPIPVSGLSVGMYVCELDRPWLDTPFVFQGFEIKSLNEIDTIAQHCEFVYVEQFADSWLQADDLATADKPRTRHSHYKNRTSSKREYNTASSLHQETQAITRSFMDDVRLGQGINVKAVKNTISACVSSILRNPDAMMWMSKIREKDADTSEHSLNTALLAITFGRHLGASIEDLNKLGLAAMFHDIGKMRIDSQLLAKKSPLNASEIKTMQSHAVLGRDILLAHKNIYHGAVDVAYCHHEALDGSGYPRHIKASGITDFTRIVTICDAYDDIINNQQRLTSLSALKRLYQHRGSRFDDKLVTEFISCIGLYPPGSIVELRNGQVGIVISINYRHRHLPKILLICDEHQQKQTEKVINLENLSAQPQQPLLIKSVLPNGSLGIRIEEYIKKGLTIE